MRRESWLGVALLLGMVGASGVDPVATREAGAASKQPPPRVEYVTLLTQHRVFGQFEDTQRVRLKQEFRVGDTEYTAKVTRFEPDFAMAMKGGRIFSRSTEPRNPAFRILVKQKGSVQDTVWAFINSPPHFARKSMLSFRVLRIDFIGRPPLPSPDTTAAGGGGR